MIAYMFVVYPENFAFKLIIVLQLSTRKICHFLKKRSFYGTFCCPFYFEIKCYSQVTKILCCFKIRNFQYIMLKDKGTNCQVFILPWLGIWKRNKTYLENLLTLKTKTYVMLCETWYHLYNLKNVKNTHGGMLLLVKVRC